MNNTKSGQFKKPIVVDEPKEFSILEYGNNLSKTSKIKNLQLPKDININNNHHHFEKISKITHSINFDTNRSLKNNQKTNKNVDAKDISKYSISRYAKNYGKPKEKGNTNIKTIKNDKIQKLNSHKNSFV